MDEIDTVTTRNLVQKRKKQLLSSVRGWLLYKSALDLWDDVNSQHAPVNGNGQQTNNQQVNSTQTSPRSNTQRPLAMRQSSSVGHLATLGRYNGDKNMSHRQSSMTLPTDVQRPAVKSMEIVSAAERKSYLANGTGNGVMVKRSKSLWRFKRSKDDEILEGMSLWQHRSLVDVHVAVQQEEQSASSTSTIVKKKSTATNTSIPLEDKPAIKKSPTPLTRTKLVPMKDEEIVQNGHVDTPPKPMERKSVKQPQNGISTLNEYNTSKRMVSPPPPSKKPAPRNAVDINDDDGLLIIRTNQQLYCTSDDDDEDEEEVDGVDEGDENTDPENGDSESCIVVDDHMKAKISMGRRQQILREASKIPLDSAPRLPRTRLLKSRKRKSRQEDEDEEVESPRADGLLYYGRTLQYRLKKPERGSRFDQVSQTTGNMYGPWYDLWGVDPSVRE